jgi:allantoin racemase
MLTACMLGKRFAIVTFAQALGPWYAECVESHGLTGRLAGLADRVNDRIPVPVVDQTAAAVKQAEALVSLQVRKATAGTFRRPGTKPTLGLAGPLAARFGESQ